MTHTQSYKVTDTKLVINLPLAFRDKVVIVTIDDAPSIHESKIALMRQAAKDPLFLADLKEVNDDFEGIEHETL